MSIEFSDRYDSLRRYVNRLTAEVEELRRQQTIRQDMVKKWESSHAESVEEHNHMAEATAVLAKYADARQEEVRERLEGLVSAGLQEVFQEDFRFNMRTKVVGKNRVDTLLTLSTTHKGVEIETSILDSRGGGVAAVAGFLLRVVSILLSGAPRFLVLDESFAQVSDEYEPRLADFISELVDSTGMRILMVTHSSAYEDASDAVYRTSQVAGKTVIKSKD